MCNEYSFICRECNSLVLWREKCDKERRHPSSTCLFVYGGAAEPPKKKEGPPRPVHRCSKNVNEEPPVFIQDKALAEFLNNISDTANSKFDEAYQALRDTQTDEKRQPMYQARKKLYFSSSRSQDVMSSMKSSDTKRFGKLMEDLGGEDAGNARIPVSLLPAFDKSREALEVAQRVAHLRNERLKTADIVAQAMQFLTSFERWQDQLYLYLLFCSGAKLPAKVAWNHEANNTFWFFPHTSELLSAKPKAGHSVLIVMSKPAKKMMKTFMPWTASMFDSAGKWISSILPSRRRSRDYYDDMEQERDDRIYDPYRPRGRSSDGRKRRDSDYRYYDDRSASVAIPGSVDAYSRRGDPFSSDYSHERQNGVNGHGYRQGHGGGLYHPTYGNEHNKAFRFPVGDAAMHGHRNVEFGKGHHHDHHDHHHKEDKGDSKGVHWTGGENKETRDEYGNVTQSAGRTKDGKTYATSRTPGGSASARHGGFEGMSTEEIKKMMLDDIRKGLGPSGGTGMSNPFSLSFPGEGSGLINSRGPGERMFASTAGKDLYNIKGLTRGLKKGETYSSTWNDTKGNKVSRGTGAGALPGGGVYSRSRGDGDHAEAAGIS